MSICRDFNTSKGCKRTLCRFSHIKSSGIGDPPPKAADKTKSPVSTSSSTPISTSKAAKKHNKTKVSPSSLFQSTHQTAKSAASTAQSTSTSGPRLKSAIRSKEGSAPKDASRNASQATDITVKPVGQSKKPSRSARYAAPSGLQKPVENAMKSSSNASSKVQTRTDNHKGRNTSLITASTQPVNQTSKSGGRMSQTGPPTEDIPISGLEAVRHLSKLCTSKVTFNKPFQMIAFVKLLTSAGAMKENWDPQDRHQFLDKATEAQGIAKFESILTYNTVVPRLSDKGALSFTSTYLGCLSYMVSDFVLDSTMHQRVDALFGVLHTHHERFNEIVTACMQDMIARRSFADPPHAAACGATIFKTLILVLVEYSTRIDAAFQENSSLPVLIENVSVWLKQWKSGDIADGWVPTSSHHRKTTVEQLDRQADRLLSIMHRKLAAINKKDDIATEELGLSPEQHHRDQVALANHLGIRYEPAGHLGRNGPRHDNDFEDIRMISIPPTEDEMLSSQASFLPVNIPGGPHHLAAGSMEQLLDIQFRLLREELLASLKMAIQSIIADLRNPSHKTILQSVLDKRGGRYTTQASRIDSATVNIYTSVQPTGVVMDRRGMAVELLMDAPPGSARLASVKKRTEYWKAISRKRLMQGGLVGLLWKTGETIQLFFGLISSSSEDLISSVKQNNHSLRIRVNIFDRAVDLKVMEWCRLEKRDKLDQQILLIEAPVMYESIRPFLQALQREPTSYPFAQYLVHRTENNSGQQIQVSPPHYTTTRPSFTWDLSCLFDAAETILRLDPTNAKSIEEARKSLKTSSRLDVSQADAMVDCLTKEFCLIQGPPGTGKSYTGVEIMRVLLTNNVRPILLIALTNHALDHLLLEVLKVGITSEVVRLGSRSNDETIAKLSLEAMEQQKDCSSVRSAYAALKSAEETLNTVVKELQGGPVSNSDRSEYLKQCYPEHREQLYHPPPWIHKLCQEDIGWTSTKDRKRKNPKSQYDFWIGGGDIRWLELQHAALETRQKMLAVRSTLAIEAGMDSPLHEEEDQSEEDDSETDEEEVNVPKPPGPNAAEIAEMEEERLRKEFLQQTGLIELPPSPSLNRPLDELRRDASVWLMSPQERARLNASWTDSIRQFFFQKKKDSFVPLKEDFEAARVHYEECRAQAKLSILGKADIIGCTTNGAAKLTNLLSGIRPQVLLVEEAGQVLESHILGSLVQSIEHLVMIGDPLQLRPNINNYGLSMEHPTGQKLYRFDQSTMERLDNLHMPMSQLSVQRRMRPEISSIPRKTLYSQLEDNERVTRYPDVRGLAKNMFFFHHTHAEGGSDEETMSKFNLFEVSMVIGLVKHLLRQEVYAKTGKIVVLCMYLGQLAKIRDGFRESTIKVILDLRDEEELLNREGEVDGKENASLAETAEVKVTDQVLLRTVDNFQGEEADVVLLSLVRNPGEKKSGSIGFLKSSNRANVALTRARHGLYVFGNGDILTQKSDMWSQVIQEFKDQDAYGTSLPISCYRHPQDIRMVQNSTQLRELSPDGGCLRSCAYTLKCGHRCPLKCHADDEEHRFVTCHEPCLHTCTRDHLCPKMCWVECGNCEYPLKELKLECGHTLSDAPCHLEDDPSTFRCREQVVKEFPNCEHSIVVDCSQNISEINCTKPCEKTLPCCQMTCYSRCGDCQQLSSLPGVRDNHIAHPCNQVLHCGHFCLQGCDTDHLKACGTADCRASCPQTCRHHICPLGCSEPCDPCSEPCPWVCEHHVCAAPCGMPCVRLPCDSRCTNLLSCNHPCPSLCGEPCEQQMCTICSGQDYTQQVVDTERGRTLADLDLSSTELENILITLQCYHSFTVQALDKHCNLASAYEWDEDSRSWSRTILPLQVFIDHPCCPTCGASITTRRYGRVIKRANLNLLERNVATKLAKQLGAIHVSFDKIRLEKSNIELKVVENVKPHSKFSLSPKKAETIKSRYEQLIGSDIARVLPAEYLGQDMYKISGLPKKAAKKWVAIIQPLLDLYISCSEMCSNHPPHINTYKTSMEMLYQKELDIVSKELALTEREAIASRVAKEQIGMVPPCANARLRVEVIWMSINIRFLMANISEKCLFNLLKSRDSNRTQLLAWATFARFVYDSCHHDSGLAMDAASAGYAPRQELLSTLQRVAAGYRRLHFEARLAQSFQRGRNLGLMSEAEAKLMLIKLKEDSRKSRLRYTSNQALSSEVLEDEFDLPLQRLFKQWKTAIDSLNSQSPLDQDIFEGYLVGRPFTEQYFRGYWYTCPNGHVFTISDYDKIIHITRCNECGANVDAIEIGPQVESNESSIGDTEPIPGIERAA